MKSNRLQIVALSLVIAALFMTGSAMAGTTTFTAIKFAREVGKVNQIYTPVTTTVAHSMNVVRSIGQNFFVDVSLDGGAKWMTSPGALTDNTGGFTTYTLLTSIGSSGVSTARYLATITTTHTTTPTVTLTMGGAQIKDIGNVLGGGGTINITIATFDSATNNAFDQSSSDTVGLITSDWSIVNSSDGLKAGSAVIDVQYDRKKFVGNTATDASASYGIKNMGYLMADGVTNYSLIAASKVTMIVSGDLSGLKYILWKGITSGTISASSATITVTGTDLTGLGLGGATPAAPITATGNFTLTVDGTTTLATRTLQVTIATVLSGGADGVADQSRTLVSTSTLTVWTLNGTVLTSVWSNGNSGSFLSRCYLWNYSSVGGEVIAQVYSLPVGTVGSTLLGTVSLGTIKETSGMNVRVAEDVLTPAGIALPYVDNGGNVVIVYTIRANKVVGVSNTFSNAFSFGMVPMAVTQ